MKRIILLAVFLMLSFVTTSCFEKVLESVTDCAVIASTHGVTLSAVKTKYEAASNVTTCNAYRKELQTYISNTKGCIDPTPYILILNNLDCSKYEIPTD